MKERVFGGSIKCYCLMFLFVVGSILLMKKPTRKSSNVHFSTETWKVLAAVCNKKSTIEGQRRALQNEENPEWIFAVDKKQFMKRLEGSTRN